MSWDNPQNLEEALILAKTLSQSTLINEGLRTPHNMLLVMGFAKSLNISPFVALRTVNVIKGKPTLGADGMAAVVRGSNLVAKLDVIDSTDSRCVVRVQRVGGEPFDVEWDMEMAKRAKLTHQENYLKYPRQMLRARCLSEACRLGWPDVVGGVYDPDELSQSPQSSGKLELEPAPKAIQAEPQKPAPKAIQAEPEPEPKDEPGRLSARSSTAWARRCGVKAEPRRVAPPEHQPEPEPEPEPDPEQEPEPEPEPKPETKPEKKTKEQEEAQAFKERAAEFIEELKERGLENAHERLLAGYVRSVTKDQRYTGKKPGDVKDFEALSSVYSELWDLVSINGETLQEKSA